MHTVAIRLRDAAGSGVRLMRAHPQAVDGIVAAAMLAVSLAWLKQYPYEPGRHLVYDKPDNQHTTFHPVGVLGYVLTVGACATLAIRRRRPVPAMWTSCALVAAYTGLDYPPTPLAWAPLLVFYTVATRLRPRRVLPYALVLFGVWLQYSLKLDVLGLLLAVLQSVLVIAVAWVFGNQTRRLAERNDRLAQLTARLRDEQAARAREAVAGERVRIARELHDVVAHHMSVISVQTGLARYVLHSDSATAAQSLDTIADATHEAMHEMRRMLVVLRPVPEDGVPEAAYRPSVEPAPGLGQLPKLLDRVRAAGLDVSMTVSGTVFPLPPGPDLCCYRVVQESLTNVMKHAAGGHARIELIYQNLDVTVRVADDGGRVRSLTEGDATVPTSQSPAMPGSGNGLAGMRERARIYGGTLQAGPRAAGGFEVVLTLPSEQDPDPEP